MNSFSPDHNKECLQCIIQTNILRYRNRLLIFTQMESYNNVNVLQTRESQSKQELTYEIRITQWHFNVKQKKKKTRIFIPNIFFFQTGD